MKIGRQGLSGSGAMVNNMASGSTASHGNHTISNGASHRHSGHGGGHGHSSRNSGNYYGTNLDKNMHNSTNYQQLNGTSSSAAMGGGRSRNSIIREDKAESVVNSRKRDRKSSSSTRGRSRKTAGTSNKDGNEQPLPQNTRDGAKNGARGDQ